MGWVEKRSGGRWRARYRGPDGREHTKTFYRKVDADLFLDRVASDKLSGAFIDPAGAKITFSDWATQWHATATDLRPSTLVREECDLKNHLLPRWGEYPIGEVRQFEVRTWVAELSKKGLSPASVRKCYQLLSKIMRAAVDAELIRQTPCRNVPQPKIEVKEMRFLTPEEVHNLAETIDPRFRALVLVGAYGGLRWGEMCALRTGRVDLETGALDIVETSVEIRGKVTYNPPKTRAGRRQVAIPKGVRLTLDRHMGRRPNPESDLVFQSPEGAPLMKSFRHRFWLPAIRAAKLAPLRIHDLRHTAVSLWIAAGASVKEIQVRAGHTSAAVVLDRYGHILPKQEEKLRSALDDVFDQASRPPLELVNEA